MQLPTSLRPLVTVSGPAHLDSPGHAGAFRVATVPGETLSSLICRLAARYRLETKTLRSIWQWRNYPPRHENGDARADAEVLLNARGRTVLAGLCGVGQDVLVRTVPSWGQEDTKPPAAPDAVPTASWRIGGAVAGPVAFGCRLCTARRTETVVRVVRYPPLRSRVCTARGRARETSIRCRRPTRSSPPNASSPSRPPSRNRAQLTGRRMFRAGLSTPLS